MSKTFAELTACTVLADGDLFAISDVSEAESRKLAASAIKTYAIGGATVGGSSAGDILTNNGSQDATLGDVTVTSLTIGSSALPGFSVFCDTATGTPAISSTTLSIGGYTNSTWHTIGPTGSGATYIWTALDGVATDANWIDIRIAFSTTISNSTNAGVSYLLYCRANGSSAAAGSTTLVFAYSKSPETYTGGYGISSTGCARVPIDTSKKINVYQVDSIELYHTTAITLALNGYGFNPA